MMAIAGKAVLLESDVMQVLVERALRPKFMILGLLCFVFIIDAARRAGFGAAMLSLLLMSLGFVGLIYVIPRVRARRLFQRIATAGESFWSCCFDDDRVTIQGPGMSIAFSYVHVSCLRETGRSFQIYTVFSSDPLIVPKRAFAADDLPPFRALVRTRVGTRSQVY
jgi:hypothetical protein